MASQFEEYAEYNRFKRSTKKQRDAGWSKDMGWRKPAMRDLTSSAGNEYKMPEEDYQEYMTFYRSAVPSELSEQYKASGRARDVLTPADYIDRAFGKNTKAKIFETPGKGHIKYMWYARTYQILKVQFWNDTIVAFFRVPAELAGFLFAEAISDITRPDKRGVERHILGIEFWNTIRIRGTVHGTRYKFEYVTDHNTGNLPGRPIGTDSYLVDELSKHANVVLNKYAKQNIDLTSDESVAARKKQLDDTLRKAIADKDITGMKNAFEAISQFNTAVNESKETVTHRKSVTGEASAEAALKSKLQREGARRMLRNYNIEKVTELVNKVIDKKDIEAFNNRFPNASEQFDYLKMRGYIPAYARFIN